MKESEFFEQVIPGPTIVLGIQLKPFSLGHVFLLTRIESPFLNRSEATLQDLVSAVFICAQTWRDNLEAIQTGTVERQWGPLRWREKTERFVRRWQRRVDGFDFEECRKAFQEYVNRASDVPGYSFDASRTRNVECPTPQLIYVRLKENFGLTEDEVYDRPWGRCISDYLTSKVVEGDLEFADHMAIQEAQRMADEFDAQIKRNGHAAN